MAKTVPPHWPETLVVVRHGDSEANIAWDLLQEDPKVWDKLRTVRDADIKLTKNGELQAEHTGKALAKEKPFDIILCSPYVRARKTAELIASQLPYSVDTEEDELLREKERGILTRRLWSEVKEKYPEEFERREIEGSYYFRPTGGQSPMDKMIELRLFADKLSRKYAGKRVLVVTHSGVVELFKKLFGNWNEEDFLNSPRIPNCSVNEFGLVRSSARPQGKLKLKRENVVLYPKEFMQRKH